jgi:F-box and WD-40 domain protein 1/11
MVEADPVCSLGTGLEFPADAEGDHEMHDAVEEDRSARHSLIHNGLSSSPEQNSLPHNRKPSLTDSVSRLSSSAISAPDTKLPIEPSIVTKLPYGVTKLSWAYLYKQRRRLEENWRKGRFINFQLPHPSHPTEAHRECVYAIQFVGKWLVSGSRDSTIRVWNLESRRLRGSPLIGHVKSVLCLQFDPSEKEDIIVSGSSDRNVIIWRFSTGEKLQELTDAHQDSVLNLRFDERFLVTCSKDKLIKVWNRRELSPSDKNYPTVFKGVGVKYPSYIVDTSSIPPAILDAQIANGQLKTLPPYSLLMTLDGHGAAVNAIQISDDEIVSASGDRSIKVWDIHSGACLKTLIGHQKGIACVQFDSRRIVSGSNDDTVRIYDHASGAEVACLHGHQNLVRTVQAGFGDPPGAEETLRLEAMAVDNEYWEARRRGDVSDLSLAPRRLRSSQIRSTGSRHPKDIMALGAMIPPGGGGSTWGRIVSGSYDETIIIWQKDQEGKWVIGQRLRQEDAAKSASEVNTHERPIHTSHPIHHAPNQAQPAAPLQSRSTQQAGQSSSSPQQPVAASHNAIQPLVNAANQTQQHHRLPNQQQFTPPNPSQGLHPSQPPPAGVLNSQVPTAGTGGVSNLPPHHHHPANQGANRPFPNPAAQPTARVFKLQFDARKLICASQDHRIVGWDFACGDKEIEEASRFFVGL